MVLGSLKDLAFKLSEDQSFSLLNGYVSEPTLKAIDDMGFKEMTEIQSVSIPVLLDLRDFFGVAKTGSGKTLAFLVPVIEFMKKVGIKARNGTGTIIISPTRELSMQTFEVLKKLTKYHKLSIGLAMGGVSRKNEADLLEKGVNILVATPGRLLDHLQHASYFNFKNLMCLVIDEADQILECGFEKEMRQIIDILPKKRQTIMFSATKTAKTEQLAQQCLNSKPSFYDEETSTVEGLEQGFVICDPEKRLLFLYSFLNRNRDKKIMVFLSTCMVINYFDRLFNSIHLPVLAIHGKQEQSHRSITFKKFCKAKSAVLLCTDVAARGLDIPEVDFIVQYDPTGDINEYIHRVGRTARGNNKKGNALLILTPDEVEFLECLQGINVTLKEYEIDLEAISDIQSTIEKVTAEVEGMETLASCAFKSFVRYYACHKNKDIYDVNDLDLNKVATSFGLNEPPIADVNQIKGGGANQDRKRKKTSSGRIYYASDDDESSSKNNNNNAKHCSSESPKKRKNFSNK